MIHTMKLNLYVQTKQKTHIHRHTRLPGTRVYFVEHTLFKFFSLDFVYSFQFQCLFLLYLNIFYIYINYITCSGRSDVTALNSSNRLIRYSL